MIPYINAGLTFKQGKVPEECNENQEDDPAKQPLNAASDSPTGANHWRGPFLKTWRSRIPGLIPVFFSVYRTEPNPGSHNNKEERKDKAWGNFDQNGCVHIQFFVSPCLSNGTFVLYLVKITSYFSLY